MDGADSRVDDDEEDGDSSDEGEPLGDSHYSDVPVVLPRSRYVGVCNVETIKDGASSGLPQALHPILG